MIVWKVLLEALVMCLIYTGFMAFLIRKNAVPLVFLYPQEVQDIVVRDGLINRNQIRANQKKFVLVSYVLLIFLMILSVFRLNRAQGFFSIWWQMVLFMEFFNLYDAFVIDAWWVRKTQAWQIPGAEGMDYIPKGSKTKKRVIAAIIAFPVMALIAWIASMLM